MASRRPRYMPTCSPIGEALETRLVMSAAGSLTAAIPQAVGHTAKTTTTVAVHAGTLGQPVTFTATVGGPKSGATPSGTVEFLEKGALVASAPLSATGTGRPGTVSVSSTVTPTPGAPSDFLGKHSVTAKFVPAGAFSASASTKAYTVAQPTFTALSDGVKFETIAPGTGPGIQSGQTANMLYTGYLAKGGSVFDDSADHGGTTFSFSVGAGEVIPGFDAATIGMQAGETRIVEIPASQGYGNTANGPIPANSTLIFVLTLESIS